VQDAVHPERVVRFGIFELDLVSEELRRNGLKLKLSGQPFQVLAILLERPGRVVTRDELQKRLWPDTFVDVDHNLNTAINKIREMLGDSAENPRYVETLPRRGYRFIHPLATPSASGMPAEPGLEDSESARPVQRTLEAKTHQIPTRRRRIAASTAVLLLVLAVMIVAAIVGGLRNRLTALIGNPHIATPTRIESIAVLPFENLSGDPSQEYFADGMTEELITQLGAFGSFRVISRTSVMRFKRTTKPLPEIARELGVDGIVEGTVARSGNHIRITANLLHASTDRHLWANSYESAMEDVLVVQGKVARSVAQAIRSELTPTPSAPRRVNPEAYEAYLEGRYHARRLTLDGFSKAEVSFHRSITLDPTFAPAYSAIAILDSAEAVNGIRPPSEVSPLGKAAAIKAVELDEHLAEAHTALGDALRAYDWDWAGAEQEHKRAVQLNPNSEDAHLYRSILLTAIGRSDEAIQEDQEGVRLDPISPYSNLFLGWGLYFARRHDESIAQLKKVLELDPEFAWANMELGWNYAAKRMYPEAVAECRRALALISDSQVVLGTCGGIYGQASKRQEALGLLERLRTLAHKSYVDQFYFAILYDGLGDTGHAIACLEKGYRERSANMYALKMVLFSDRTRSDPRFQALLKKLNYPS